jgi:FMN phosphatase YigB (HAD superfamily)
MKANTVIFDLDNTIYSESDYFHCVFNQFCDANKINFQVFEFLFDNFDYYRFNKKDIFKFALEEVNLFNETYHNQLFQLFISIECKINPYSGINEWFEYCLNNNLKIAILTNGIITAQNNKWNCLNLTNKDNCHFVPARIFQNEKPSSDAFNGILNQLNVSWEDCIFVGDRYENDLEQGVKNGSHGILIGDESNHKNIQAFSSIQEAFNYFQTL